MKPIQVITLLFQMLILVVMVVTYHIESKGREYINERLDSQRDQIVELRAAKEGFEDALNNDRKRDCATRGGKWSYEWGGGMQCKVGVTTYDLDSSYEWKAYEKSTLNPVPAIEKTKPVTVINGSAGFECCGGGSGNAANTGGGGSCVCVTSTH